MAERNKSVCNRALCDECCAKGECCGDCGKYITTTKNLRICSKNNVVIFPDDIFDFFKDDRKKISGFILNNNEILHNLQQACISENQNKNKYDKEICEKISSYNSCLNLIKLYEDGCSYNMNVGKAMYELILLSKDIIDFIDRQEKGGTENEEAF